MEIFLSKQCKEIDRITIENIGIPSIVLMENAASSVCAEIRNKGESFFIFCGHGNNGGDGLAIARHLISIGKKVKLMIIGINEKYTDDFITNLKILDNIGNVDITKINKEEDINEKLINEIKHYDVIVDCIFGVGLNRKLTGIFELLIKQLNENSKLIVSVDVPSGLNCDSGLEEGIAIKADFTYTFEVLKEGFLNYNAIKYLGKVKVLNIGIPDIVKKENSNNLYILNKKEYKNLVPKRKIYGHKGNYGRSVIIAGSVGFTGAAFITTECTVRAGCGLTTLVCPEKIQPILSEKLTEAMTLSIESKKLDELLKQADVIAMGPGLGIGERQEKLMEKIINNTTCPIVFDADAITLLAKNKSLMKYLGGRLIMTPHPGELARFMDTTISEIENNRIKIAKKLSKEYNSIILLKGYNTVISNGVDTYINPTGNSKMASGGMGDALTGIITALVSQGMQLDKASLLGAYIHGAIAEDLSETSYIINARDIIENLPLKINSLIKE
ncbi:NAD(P)H-hydrate dehydratase [Clostridium weizhouense]|uniref:Bifunctional NAD(P)H-hydrate repair enzyme n=1 Tax=Clostridium weizhouense TaxID=2859781 RepID=A0ABS7ARY6_9CLOT|nr:NAD(P)H-hydrate dehydratase [Clostridium weizhouense]MBW6411452.1 NAD(P)H-hydrate dehydratase [Clostridium weizhouense]